MAAPGALSVGAEVVVDRVGKTCGGRIRALDDVSFTLAPGVFVLLTGMYLAYYWYTGIKDDTGTPGVISGAESWQTTLSSFIRRNQSMVVLLSSLVIAAAIGFAILNKRRHHPA